MITFRERPWYALHVRSRHEKLVDVQLTGKGLSSFLPTYKSRRPWSDRVKEVELPLFPGYVFSSFTPEDQLEVIKSSGVVSIVGFGKQIATVSPHELEQVQLLAGSGLLAMPCPFLTAGEKVYLEHGPLKGLEGIVLNLRGSLRVVVSVSLLQRAVSVEIDRHWIRPLRSTFLPASLDLASLLASRTSSS